MTGWKEYRLNDLGEILDSRRIPLSSLERAKRQGQYPYYGASGIVDYIDDYIFDGEHVLISEDGENLLSRNTPIAFIVSDKFWVNNHAHIFKGNAPFINRIVMHYLQSSDLNEFITGAAQPKLSQRALLSIPFYLPAESMEQKAIATVLSSLDDKIDLLHRQNATLEAMAEALFSQLFIAAEQKKELDAIVKWISFNPKRSIANGHIAPYLEMSNVNTTTFHPSDITYKEFSSGMKFVNYDTLLARITPCLENGKTCYVTFLENEQVGWGSTEYIVMRPNTLLHPFFAYCLAKTDDFRAYAENCLTGSSGRQRVDSAHLKRYEIVSPPPQSIEGFNRFAASIVPKLHDNFIQACTLEKLRDTILPKLMSGEVRVQYTGKFVEATI
ncbi:MAG: restriction endonuclease subunit S [Desulfobulbaceae bacterium]|jgi:type I restriction enzyme S subunit|nr:restriction endonuclease subunit S [Desulfobulbaceae bacterium]